MTDALLDLDAFQAVHAGDGPVLLRLRVTFRTDVGGAVPALLAGDERFEAIPGSISGPPEPGRPWQAAFGVPAPLVGDPETPFALDIGEAVELPPPARRILGAPARIAPGDEDVTSEAIRRERARGERAWDAMRAANRRATELDRRASAAEARADALRERADGLARQLEAARSTAWRLAGLAAEVPRLRRRLETGPEISPEDVAAERVDSARRLDELALRHREETARASALAAELEEAGGRVDVLVAEVERTRIAQLEASSRAEALERQVAEAHDQLRARDAEMASLRDSLADDGDPLQGRLAVLESQLAEHRATRATFVERLSEAERNLERTRIELAESTAEIERLDHALQDARAAEQAAEARADEATEQLQERLGYLKSRLTTVQAREQEERRLREQLERALQERG